MHYLLSFFMQGLLDRSREGCIDYNRLTTLLRDWRYQVLVQLSQVLNLDMLVSPGA